MSRELAKMNLIERRLAMLEIKAILEERVSKEGKKYTVIVIKLTDDYEMIVFPKKAEIELFKLKAKSTFNK